MVVSTTEDRTRTTTFSLAPPFLSSFGCFSPSSWVAVRCCRSNRVYAALLISSFLRPITKRNRVSLRA